MDANHLKAVFTGVAAARDVQVEALDEDERGFAECEGAQVIRGPEDSSQPPLQETPVLQHFVLDLACSGAHTAVPLFQLLLEPRRIALAPPRVRDDVEGIFVVLRDDGIVDDILIPPFSLRRTDRVRVTPVSVTRAEEVRAAFFKFKLQLFVVYLLLRQPKTVGFRTRFSRRLPKLASIIPASRLFSAFNGPGVIDIFTKHVQPSSLGSCPTNAGLGRRSRKSFALDTTQQYLLHVKSNRMICMRNSSLSGSQRLEERHSLRPALQQRKQGVQGPERRGDDVVDHISRNIGRARRPEVDTAPDEALLRPAIPPMHPPAG
ncbi:hypothetical protein EVG20_g9084 [Dentipellis fragilis]|uniref:Uncharacterized protein n=1 Tax=Dentipellis fragilis TaxID=205917 RepID=A0A4Y9Y140_9AGAM|nr:hypothetical protein EVG20_g9084 [Dentipellis fragilis]